jgi:hypothetical protein
MFYNDTLLLFRKCFLGTVEDPLSYRCYLEKI